MSFKVCSNCCKVWNDRDAFLGDPSVVVVGYQVDFEALRSGLLLFNHADPSCMTTMAIPAKEFFDLYEGPIFERRTKPHPDCPRRCLDARDLNPCPLACECGFVREILQTVKVWPKTKTGRI